MLITMSDHLEHFDVVWNKVERRGWDRASALNHRGTAPQLLPAPGPAGASRPRFITLILTSPPPTKTNKLENKGTLEQRLKKEMKHTRVLI